MEALDIASVLVEKRSGLTEQFSRSKLTRSIQKAAITEIPTGDVNEIVDKVIQALTLEHDSGLDAGTTTVSSVEIGRTVMRNLRDEPRLEAVHVRYALLFEARQGSFEDAVSFLRWLRKQGLVNTDLRGSKEEPDWVVKRNGTLAPFNLHKLATSIRYAAKKRPDEHEQQQDLRLGDVFALAVLETVRHQRVVTSGQLAAEVMRLFRSAVPQTELLREGERQLAYLRVASTAKSFTRADDFAAEAKGLIEDA